MVTKINICTLDIYLFIYLFIYNIYKCLIIQKEEIEKGVVD
jgi:hypothetical protein